MYEFISPRLSLADILGEEYMKQVSEAGRFIGTDNSEDFTHLKVEFFSEDRQKFQDSLLKFVGDRVKDEWINEVDGAPTNSFGKAAHKNSAAVGGFGCFRVGEDGKLYLIGKSEHYHASLGHCFNGYKLIEYAKKIGISNATHNNSRGYITRLLESRLIESIGVPKLDRVINLETGSLSVEAGIKMMMARFYRLDSTFKMPKYNGKIPVFFVMCGNYHGTTVLTQTFRGMWGDIYKKIEDAGIYKVVQLIPNDIEDFQSKMLQYNSGNFKTAGFLHEIIMMNFGALRLTEEYLRTAYKLCSETDTPTLADEIQTCMWYPGMFLFKLYGLEPDFVAIGKGFPGGEYPASKIITTAEMDNLSQFGALVTNGQEELASLAYLITMEFAKANSQITAWLGAYFNHRLKEISKKYPSIATCAEGMGYCSSIRFLNVDTAAECADSLNRICIDCSVQLYKADCSPALLMKPPLTASLAVLDYICNSVDKVMKEVLL